MAASVWLMSGWCPILVAGVADCYFAPGVAVAYPRHASRGVAFIHSFLKLLMKCRLFEFEALRDHREVRADLFQGIVS